MLRLPCLGAVAGLLLVTSPRGTAESIRGAAMPVSLVILGTCLACRPTPRLCEAPFSVNRR